MALWIIPGWRLPSESGGGLIGIGSNQADSGVGLDGAVLRHLCCEGVLIRAAFIAGKQHFKYKVRGGMVGTVH